MDYRQASKKVGSNETGIALFMVVSSMTLLIMLVTEFTYIAQINSKIAYDALDQVRALYTAKSAFKISLLRLKAYQNAKKAISSMGSGASSAVPDSALNPIWQFPLLFPIPTEIPGLTSFQKDSIKKFQDKSGLEGNFTAIIESESGKMNLNSFLPNFTAPAPAATSTPTPSPASGSGTAGTQPQPTPTPSFNPEDAQKAMTAFFAQVIQSEAMKNEDFSAEYRDMRLDQLMANIFAWADPYYSNSLVRRDLDIRPKRAPFYSTSELRQVPGMDDYLYRLFSDVLTTSITAGVNLNTMKDSTLNAIVPGLTAAEVKEFFKYRDSTEKDQKFKADEDFFKWLEQYTNAYRGGTSQLKEKLKSQNIRFIFDETQFKISVTATVNSATKTIEAWVTFKPQTSTSTAGGSGSATPGGVAAPAATGNTSTSLENETVPDPGMKVTFMRVL